jgi:hypothetical protein
MQAETGLDVPQQSEFELGRSEMDGEKRRTASSLL